MIPEREMRDWNMKKEIQIILPEQVSFIINTLNQAGFEAYAVGGCVRDSIMGRVPDDWDITTSADPQQASSGHLCSCSCGAVCLAPTRL